MRHYYYTDSKNVIRIKAKKKPSKRVKPYSLREFDGEAFVMPCFPEVTYTRLSKMDYIGSVEIPPRKPKDDGWKETRAYCS